jgi:4-diphosphocytidyl-2-C-methyl-D-erythritol kinase
MKEAPATAKLNLALVVGSMRADGKHEVATVMQGIALADRIALEQTSRLEVTGFTEDTIVRSALERLAEDAGVTPMWSVRITKRIPVAAGLGGGSSDAATALRLANGTLPRPLRSERLHELAASLGADVPFFLEDGPALGTGDGSTLAPLDLPQDYAVLLVLPTGAVKPSTATVYAAFDDADGAEGFAERRARLEVTLAGVETARDLAELPPNDLASSPLADELCRLGAFRAGVTGAGPTVYGLFLDDVAAKRAQDAVGKVARTWLTRPAWYV